METINSIGFTNFWGVTPAYNVLNNEYYDLSEVQSEKNINILISSSSDIRHIIRTISNTLEKYSDKEFPYCLNFYIFETAKENLARSILFMHIINDTTIAIRDRVEILMEVYGNTLLSSRTAEYVNAVYKELIRFVSGDIKYKGCLNELIDLSLLNYRDKDDIVDILSAYDLKFSYDIEKYRDDRLRYHYKERYDYRDNISDWDYHMNLKSFAPIISQKHYIDFRRTGVAFELRINKYNIPNRTLSSYVEGREVNTFNYARKKPKTHAT